ncbi:unnamed protein product [Rotaria socialis]|uniref:Transposase n=1 Tax=Rotaria socialis TaxID=392032 RepID=A0A817R2F0_9BILA|nr:unnamed protein product [Rotaria socialis]
MEQSIDCCPTKRLRTTYEQNSCSTFECLSDELIFDIFEYFNMKEIFQSFSNLNSFITSCIFDRRQQLHLHLDHEMPFLLGNDLSNHVTSLYIDRIIIPIGAFLNLKSLTIVDGNECEDQCLNMINENNEFNRYYIKIRTILGIDPKAIHEELVTELGPNAPSYTTVTTWAKRFREGREEVNDDPRFGGPVPELTDENIELVRQVISNDSHSTYDEIIAEISLSHGTTERIIHDCLKMKKGPVLIHCVDEGKIIDYNYYIENFLKLVIKDLLKQRRSAGTKGIELLHDNARPHIHSDVINYLTEEGINIMPHPPHSSDLAPCDYWLNDYIKRNLTDQPNEKSLARAVSTLMKKIPKEAFKIKLLTNC